MPTPITLNCHVCGFTTTDPDAFAAHMAETKHLGDVPIQPESGDLAELAKVLGMIQGGIHLHPEDLPDGMEIRRITREDIENDPDLDDAERARVLSFFDKEGDD